jgi:hypothetical protein
MLATAADVRNLLQPSDNLQQASTAQAEPANEAVSADDMGNAIRAIPIQEPHKIGDTELTEGERYFFGKGFWRGRDAAAELVKSYAGCMLCGNGIGHDLDCKNHPVQATPEGADLPPLTFDRRWSLARDGFGLERNDESGEYVSHDDAVAVIHANLAATTAAEPVAWRVTFNDFRHFLGAITAGRDYVELKKPELDNRFFEGCDSLVVTPLYRAAPPQPVTPMTPEMLRAVQLRSEVGTYITANWANAYDCLQELCRVACEAQGKQVDTGGLPG